MPTILLKKSDTPGSVPGTANLTNLAGGVEVAVNTADKRVYSMTSASAVIELGTNPSSLTCSDVSATVLRSASATITNLIATSVSITTLTNNPTFSAGTANGVLYLNGSKVATSGSALQFDGTNLGIGGSGDPFGRFYGRSVGLTSASGAFLEINAATGNTSGIDFGVNASRTAGITSNATETNFTTIGATPLLFGINSAEQMRLTSTGLGIGTASPAQKLAVRSADNSGATNIALFESNNGAQNVVIRFAQVLGQNGDFTTGTATNHNYIFATNGTEKARIDTSGNLGLGVTPSAWNTAGGTRAFEFNNNLGSGSVAGWFGSVNLMNNAIFSATGGGTMRYVATGVATQYQQSAGAHLWFTAPSGTAGNAISFTQAMTLNASNNLLLGTTSDPGYGRTTASVYNTNGGLIQVAGSATTALFYVYQPDNIAVIGTTTNHPFAFYSNNTERGRFSAGGQFLVGTTTAGVGGSGNTIFTAKGNADTYASIIASGNEELLLASQAGITKVGAYSNHPLLFITNNTERARITSGGEFIGGKTTAGVDTNGWELGPSGVVGVSRQADIPMYVNRNGDDGILVSYRQDGNGEGSVSVSGNTVSYNAFAGSHWSQLQDGSKPDILRGTVMESINELCVWPGEQNERLPKSKISDTAGSKKVYGVFMAWDNDWTETNDMYVTAVGAFICRVNGSVTVQEGDLLESNGDGTARVQADDIIRSSTIGKVTSTVKTHQYDDGSYCVPTVLYCG